MTARLATNNNGIITWRWEGEAFGNTPAQELGTVSVNLRFPGRYYDAETNLHYNHFRYYGPSLGRYITSGPIGLDGDMNTYSYAALNPLSFIDVKGLSVTYILTCPPAPSGSNLVDAKPLFLTSRSCMWVFYNRNKKPRLVCVNSTRKVCYEAKCKYIRVSQTGKCPEIDEIILAGTCSEEYTF